MSKLFLKARWERFGLNEIRYFIGDCEIGKVKIRGSNYILTVFNNSSVANNIKQLTRGMAALVDDWFASLNEDVIVKHPEDIP